MDDTLFGSAVRTDTLVTIGRLKRTYPSEIARIVSGRVIEIQRAVTSLEKAGVVVSNRIGTTRIVELNPTFWAKDELYALLLRISEMPTYANLWPKIRRRPRAMGKPAQSLEDLLSRVTKRNLHGEVDTGTPVGRDAW